MNKLIRITTIPLSLEKLLEHQLRFMNDHYKVTAISSDSERLKNVGYKEGVSTYCLEMSREITPIKDLKALWNLFKFLRTEAPLIVHTHTPKAGIIGMLASKLARVPVRLHTVAGLPLMEVTGPKRILLNVVEKITYLCASKVYPNSFGLKNVIISEKFCSENKLKVLGNGSSNGINTTYFNTTNFQQSELNDIRTSLSIEDLDFVFIFVGRLVGDKGINELVSAFTKINVDYPHSRLLLVGPFEPELDPLSPLTIEEIQNNLSIKLIGYQSDVRSFLAISDALVFPSYREGFPNVIMQAGAMGLPSIVSDINGCNEIIKPGENGIIVPSKDTKALYNAMKKILLDKELSSKLKSNARRMIVERYEQQIIWDAILAEYKQLEKNVQRRNKKNF